MTVENALHILEASCLSKMQEEDAVDERGHNLQNLVSLSLNDLQSDGTLILSSQS